MQIAVYALGAILIIVSMFMGGWISWVIGLIGVVLTYVANAIGSKEAVGETDKTILALLFHASYQDQNFAEEEQQYIVEYIKRRGLSQKQVKIVEKYAQDPSKWKISEDAEQQMRIIDEVVGLIKCDGTVTDGERTFLSNVAKMLNIDEKKALAKLG